MTEEKMLDDRREQMKASQELAPEGLLYSLGAPWKALENALRNRNFENKQLCNKIVCMEETLAALWEIVQGTAEADPVYYNHRDSCFYCIYCRGVQAFDQWFEKNPTFKHELHCTWIKAQALVAQNDQQSH